MISSAVLCAFFALTFIAPAELSNIILNEPAKIERNIESLRNKMNELSDKFNAINQYKPEAKPYDLMKEFQYDGSNVSLTDAIQINILRGRIGVAVMTVNRTVHHALDSVERFRYRAEYVTGMVRNRSQVQLDTEKTNILNLVKEHIKSTGADIDFGFLPCLADILAQIEALLISILEDIECCIQAVLETLEINIEALFCELISLIQNLEITLNGLAGCVPLLTPPGLNLGTCLTSIITGLQTTLDAILLSVNNILGTVGNLLGNLLIDLGNCVQPILASLGTSLGPLLTTLEACLAQLIG